jgi:hypothetical protein
LSTILAPSATDFAERLFKRNPEAMEQVTEQLTRADKPTTFSDNFLVDNIDDGLDSASAARVAKLSLEDQSPIMPENNFVKGIFKGGLSVQKVMSPKVSLLNSDLLSVRNAAEKLFGSDVALKKNEKGIATEVGIINKIQTWHGDGALDLKTIKTNYKNYRKDASAQGQKEIMSSDEFYSLVSRARNNGLDTVSDNKIADKYIVETSKNLKSIDRITRDGVELGMLDSAAPKNSVNWLHRIWMPEKVIGNLPKAKQVFTNSFTKTFKKDAQRAAQFFADPNVKVNYDNAISVLEDKLATGKFDIDKVNKAKRIVKEYEDFLEIQRHVDDNTADVYIKESVDKTIQNITGRDNLTGSAMITMNDRGMFKDRVIDLPYEDIEFMLETRIDKIIEKSINVSAPEIEIYRAFGTNRLDLENEAFKGINEEFNEALAKTTDDIARRKLYNKYSEDIRDLAGSFDLVRGTFKGRGANYNEFIDRGLTAFRNITFLNMMGKASISSLADPFIIGYANGYAKTFGTYFKKIFASPEFKALSRADMMSAGKTLNYELATRSTAMYDLGNPFASGNAIERGLRYASNKMGNINLLNQWTDVGESVAYLTTSDRVLRNLNKWKNGKLNKKGEIQLSSDGIGIADREAVLQQIQKYSVYDKKSGLTAFNTNAWDNRNAARLIDGVMSKSITSQVVMKQAGDVPFALESPLGKFFTQFMAFGLAANNKLLLKGLQNADANFVILNMNLIMFGVIQQALKAKLNNREIETDTHQLIINTLDQHPMLMLPMFIHKQGGNLNMWEQASLKRVSSSDAITSLLGVNAVTAKRLIETGQAFGNMAIGRAPSESQINSIGKVIPFNNWFLTQPIRDALTESANKAYEPERKLQTKQRGVELKQKRAEKKARGDVF